MVREEWKRKLTFAEYVGDLISQNMWMSCLILFWDEETEVELFIWCQAHERDWAAACCLQTLHLIHSQAELWPRFLRFALQGAQAPRVPAWSPACGHWGPRPTSFPGGVVDFVGWHWGWVPRGLHLKCRSSFCFFFFYCENNLRLNSEGCLD